MGRSDVRLTAPKTLKKLSSETKGPGCYRILFGDEILPSDMGIISQAMKFL